MSRVVFEIIILIVGLFGGISIGFNLGKKAALEGMEKFANNKKETTE